MANVVAVRGRRAAGGRRPGRGRRRRCATATTSSAGASTSTAAAAATRSTSDFHSQPAPRNVGWVSRIIGSPSTGVMCSRGPATSMRPGSTTRSRSVPSSAHASWCRRRPVHPGAAPTATTSTPGPRGARSATSSRSPITGTPAHSPRPAGRARGDDGPAVLGGAAGAPDEVGDRLGRADREDAGQADPAATPAVAHHPAEPAPGEDGDDRDGQHDERDRLEPVVAQRDLGQRQHEQRPRAGLHDAAVLEPAGRRRRRGAQQRPSARAVPSRTTRATTTSRGVERVGGAEPRERRDAEGPTAATIARSAAITAPATVRRARRAVSVAPRSRTAAGRAGTAVDLGVDHGRRRNHPGRGGPDTRHRRSPRLCRSGRAGRRAHPSIERPTVSATPFGARDRPVERGMASRATGDVSYSYPSPCASAPGRRRETDAGPRASPVANAARRHPIRWLADPTLDAGRPGALPTSRRARSPPDRVISSPAARAGPRPSRWRTPA